ncbi:MAG: DUF4124 domain-containing protein [Porticoccaceae bacterium]|nr:DUF4124 domain-containing protein [Porticoccaceae bacterium]
MKNTLLVVSALLMVFPAMAMAEIYKCSGKNGRTSFSDKPCGKNSQVVEVEVDVNSIDLGAQGDWGKVTEANEERERQRSIEKHQAGIKKLQSERDTAIAELKYKQRFAANNSAGATYHRSLAMEMGSVTDDYNNRIQRHQDAVNHLRSQ